MNLTYFRSEMRENVKKQEPSQHQICRQYIRHQKSIWEHHIWFRKNIRSGNTSINDPELLVLSRGRRKGTAPLFRHKR